MLWTQVLSLMQAFEAEVGALMAVRLLFLQRAASTIICFFAAVHAAYHGLLSGGHGTGRPYQSIRIAGNSGTEHGTQSGCSIVI